jgi:two-component system NtrC family response regulator
MMLDKSSTLLIVEDDLALQKQIKWSLDKFESVTASDRESAMVQLRRYRSPVVTMDLGLPPDADTVREGFLLLEQILAIDADIKIIVLTGQNDQANALNAIALGAFDFLEKPFSIEALNLIVERAFRMSQLQTENRRLQEVSQPDSLIGIVTRDPEMLRICRMIDKVAMSDATVMLLGESGTGKELLARGLHQSSPRRNEKFVAINCAAIPENLLESELFGYEKGAFTGASKLTLGKIESANGGTLMLDEIGDLPFQLQAKLLRFLQERVIERIGGRTEIPVDVRIVCATHKNLDELTKVGSFREDLYYRLAEIIVNIPPLRLRTGDPALLAHSFVHRFSLQQKKPFLSLSEEAVRLVEQYSWPGNIRELENCIRRATIMSDGPLISSQDLGLTFAFACDVENGFDLRLVRDKAEKKAVISALGRVNGNMVKTAELLGVSRPTLYDLMSRLNLK